MFANTRRPTLNGVCVCYAPCKSRSAPISREWIEKKEGAFAILEAQGPIV